MQHMLLVLMQSRVNDMVTLLDSFIESRNDKRYVWSDYECDGTMCGRFSFCRFVLASGAGSSYPSHAQFAVKDADAPSRGETVLG